MNIDEGTILVTTATVVGEGVIAESNATPGCWGLGPTREAAIDDFVSVYREWRVL